MGVVRSGVDGQPLVDVGEAPRWDRVATLRIVVVPMRGPLDLLTRIRIFVSLTRLTSRFNRHAP
jgi:hypothetical protein